MAKSFLIAALFLTFYSCFLQAQQVNEAPARTSDELSMAKFLAMEGEIVTFAFNAEITLKGQKAIEMYVEKVANEFSEKDLVDGLPELLRKMVLRICRDTEFVETQEFLIEGFSREKPRLDCDTTCYLVLFILENIQRRFPKQDLLSHLYFAGAINHMLCAIRTEEGFLYANLNVSLQKWHHLSFMGKPLYLAWYGYFPAEPLKPVPCKEATVFLLGHLGRFWFNREQYNKALNAFDAVLSKFPEEPNARCGKFRTLNAQGYKVEALKYFEQHIKEIWSEKDYSIASGLYAEQEGDVERAIDLAELALLALEKNRKHVKKCNGCQVLQRKLLKNLAWYARNFAKTLRIQNQAAKAALFEQKAYFAEQIANNLAPNSLPD